tara:strand:- start:656 stop:1177 length:522 start_codon:yes stop_codon:yes gene_type:complete
MIKFFFQKLESAYKDLSNNKSFSEKSVEKSVDYLWDIYNCARDIHKDNSLETCYPKHIFLSDVFNGYHYFHLKKNYDGNPEEFLDFYILKVFYFHFEVKNHNYPDLDDMYLLYKNNFLKRSKNFENGISLAEEDFNDDLKIKNMKTSDEKLLAQIDHIKFRRFEEIYAKFKEL